MTAVKKVRLFVYLPMLRSGSVSKMAMVTPMALISKVLFPSISTFETLPVVRVGPPAIR